MVTNKRIIGIAGFKGSGKTTIADYWTETEGVAISCPLAEPIKKMAQCMYPVLAEVDLDSQAIKAGKIGYSGHTVRDLLRIIGSSMRDNLGRDIWCQILEARLKEIPKHVPAIIVPDVRMPYEVDWIHALGGHLIWVTRPGYESDGDITEQDLAKHANTVVSNSGTISELYETLVLITGDIMA